MTAAPDPEEAAERAPHVAAVHAAEPDANAQVTPLLPLSLATTAVNVAVLPACTEPAIGETVTEMAGVGAGEGPLGLPLPVTAAQPYKNRTAGSKSTAKKTNALRATRAEEVGLNRKSPGRLSSTCKILITGFSGT